MSKWNWLAIAEIPDDRTRIAVSLATDPKILSCYARGFPHLFTEGDDEGPLRIPLTALMESAAEYSLEQWDSETVEQDRHFALGLAFEKNPHLNIPIAHI